MKKIKIYSSSAGSGKTFTLARKYIEFALAVDKKDNYSAAQTVPSILAITFTNNSTKEMKDRIIKYLEEIYLNPENSQILKIIEKDASVPVNELKNRAKAALDYIFSNYNDFHISTIDSFLQKILRTFSREVDIPINYDITLDEGEIIEYATDKIFDEYGINKSISQSMTTMAFEKLSLGESWDITNAIKKYAGKFFKRIETDNVKFQLMGKEELLLDKEKFINNYKNIYKTLNKINKEVKEKAKSFLSEMDINDDCKNKISHFNYIETFCNKLLNDEIPNYSPSILVHYQKFTLKKGVEMTDKLIELNARFREIFDLSRQILKLKIIRKKLNLLFIYFFIEDEIAKFKSSRNILFLSDGVKIIKNLNENADSQIVSDFIFYKLGERFSHILIDEFQDTSFEQWKALYPLAREALENNGDVILVGDIKQAIYRWRGGERMIMESLLNDDGVEVEVLDKNFRSAKQLVEFNNEFFNNLKNDESIFWDPKDISQIPFHKNKNGYVEIKELPKEKDEFILNYIREISMRRGTPNDPAYGDITVLIRRNKDTDGLIPLLLDNDIPVISRDALQIGFDPFVQFIVSILGYFNEPDNYKNKFYILLFNYLNVSMERIVKNVDNIKKMTPDEFFEFIAKDNEELKNGLKELYDLREGISLYGLIVSFTTLFNDIIHKHVPYISALLSIVKTNLDTGGISEFLDKWDELKESAMGAALGVNSVNISTIHKAKGLEYPVVLFPYEPKDINDEKNGIVRVKYGDFVSYVDTKISNMGVFNEVDEEYENSNYDYGNLLYVTYTRAKDELYIFPSMGIDKKGQWKPSKFGERMRSLTEGSKLLSSSSEENDFIKRHYGTPPKNVEKKVENISLKPLAFNNFKWQKRLIISRVKRKYDEKESQEIKFGNAFHMYMEMLKDFEFDSTLYTFICNKFQLDGSEQRKLSDAINTVLGSNVIKELSEYEIKKEVPIIFNKNHIDRIDLLALNVDNAIIIDYKTGKEDNEYIQKMKEYISIIKNAGYNNVYGVLLFTTGKEIKVEN